MGVRLITVKEDFERVYGILNQREYPLSFYEYTLKHDLYQNKKKLKLIGAFKVDDCLGTISYKIAQCPNLGKVLEIMEIHHKTLSAYSFLMDFINEIARDEVCDNIKIRKNMPEQLNHSIFDRFEIFLKNIVN